MTTPAPLTRDQRRGRRKREVRARSISVRHSLRELVRLRVLNSEMYPDVRRPRTRGECEGQNRPCPFVSCEWHLYIDVSESTGSLRLNFPDLEVWEMGESCTLDVADRGGTTLEDVGAIMNLTRERIRQLELKAIANAGPELTTLLGEVPDDSVSTSVKRPSGLQDEPTRLSDSLVDDWEFGARDLMLAEVSP